MVFDSCCGYDTDDLFAYSTAKYVRIRDRRLGVTILQPPSSSSESLTSYQPLYINLYRSHELLLPVSDIYICNCLQHYWTGILCSPYRATPLLYTSQPSYQISLLIAHTIRTHIVWLSREVHPQRVCSIKSTPSSRWSNLRYSLVSFEVSITQWNTLLRTVQWHYTYPGESLQLCFLWWYVCMY